MFRLACLLFAMVLSTGAWATLDIEYFTKESTYKSVKISPDGRYIAVKMPQEGLDRLAIIDLDDMSIKHVVRFAGKQEVGDYHWASDDRLIFQLMANKGWLAAPQWYGEWYAVNADGSKDRNIFGYRAGEMQTGTRMKKQKSSRAWGYLIDPLPEDEDHVLMASEPMSSKGDKTATLIRLNIHNGRIKRLGRSPVVEGYYLADQQGEVRFATGENQAGDWEVHYRAKRGADWQQIALEKQQFGEMKPLSFADADHVYLVSDHEHDINGLYKMNVNDGSMKLLFRDEQVDPSNFHFSPDGRQLYALEVEPGYPNYIFIRGKHPSAKLLKGLMAAFPNKQVSLTSQSLDGSRSVVAAYSDQQPITFYLYDQKANSVRQLVASRDWVDANSAAQVTPIHFDARDGYPLQGYLTLPTGVTLEEAKSLPMVVNPHGGPRERDSWSYNYETQLMASRGFAVLQVNFRGSAGFGDAHMHAGDKAWGSTSQFDIIDGTRYVIEQGIADGNRVCIYGASFGGYSALQSAILEPDLFRCVAGSMGVYDLPMMFEEGDIQERQSGLNYLKEVLGTDQAQLSAFSPAHNVDKLKAPLLLLHGEEDVRTPIEQVESLREALDKRNYDYDYFEMNKEGHGLADPKTRKAYYQTLMSFIEQNTKL